MCMKASHLTGEGVLCHETISLYYRKPGRGGRGGREENFSIKGDHLVSSVISHCFETGPKVMCTWVGEEGEKGGDEMKGHSGDRTWEEGYGENRLPCFSFL